MNFILSQMQHLKYFMPLIEEGNRRGIKSTMYFCKVKQSYDAATNHIETLKELSNAYSFNLLPYSAASINGLTFVAERRWPISDDINGKKVALTVQLDFTHGGWYDEYVRKVDNVVFMSPFFAENYGKISNKNVYLGTPKYDVKIEGDILSKYSLEQGKYALIIYPHPLGGSDVDLQRIYNLLSKEGYKTIVKSRRKFTQCLENNNKSIFKGDYYFEEFSWYPHTTMELMSISDIVINTDSGAAEECVMMDVPYINVKSKVNKKRYPNGPLLYDFLNEFSFMSELKTNFLDKKFCTELSRLTKADFADEFLDARHKYLQLQTHNASSIIIDQLS